MVLTIESTLITACSSESLVSKGHFKNFCIRFAEGFETSWDDWKPEIRGDLVMNACEWGFLFLNVIFVSRMVYFASVLSPERNVLKNKPFFVLQLAFLKYSLNDWVSEMLSKQKFQKHF